MNDLEIIAARCESSDSGGEWEKGQDEQRERERVSARHGYTEIRLKMK
jgi:hypothetical protein